MSLDPPTNSAPDHHSPPQKKEKYIDLGEIAHGEIPSSTWNYPWFALLLKADVWMLDCTVGHVFKLFTTYCHLIPRFFKDISFVDCKATRPWGEGRRRWGHAWLAYFHVWGCYSAGIRPQVQIKRGIFWRKRYAHFFFGCLSLRLFIFA